MNLSTWLEANIDNQMQEFKTDKTWNYLKSVFNVNNEDIKQTYFNYEKNVHKFGNEIYNSIEIRFVLYLLTRKKFSWHQKKQNIVNNWLNKIWPCCVADIGFGVPQMYHIQKYTAYNNGFFLLVEYNDLALNFARSLFSFYDRNLNSLDFINGEFKNEIEYGLSVSPKSWLFLDSLEHFEDPESILNKCVNTSKNNTYFIFSLPIGEHVPVHSYTWSTSSDILIWLQNMHLSIIDYFILSPDPNVEWFIHSLKYPYSFHECLVLANI